MFKCKSLPSIPLVMLKTNELHHSLRAENEMSVNDIYQTEQMHQRIYRKVNLINYASLVNLPMHW